MKSVVIFGGTGFIGTHLAQHLLTRDLAETIFLVDLAPPRDFPYSRQLQSALKSGRAVYVQHDVRQSVPQGLLPQNAELVFNLAAIHREPGHAPLAQDVRCCDLSEADAKPERQNEDAPERQR